MVLVSVPSQNYSMNRKISGETSRHFQFFFSKKFRNFFRGVVKHIAKHACLSVKHSIPSKSGLIHETMSETISIEFIV